VIKRWTLLAGLAAIALTPSSAIAVARGADAASPGQAGLDMALADPDGMPAEPEFAREDLPDVAFAEWSGAPADLAGVPVHHLYTDLRRALVRYQLSWGALPQVVIPGRGAIGSDVTGRRLMALRQRLGFDPKGELDNAVHAKLRAFQAVHALAVDGLAGEETLAALNLGAAYYERLVLLNMERARRLPAPGTGSKFIVVDAGAALLTMYEGGEPVGSMKVVVGAAKSQTPMISTQLRYAAVNPYWNVPPDLVAKLIAPKVLAQGRTYLVDRRYQVLSDWTETATPVEPEAVNWQAVADQSEELRVRQLPGGANSMGRIKFLMPNKYGVYLHDTPNRALFEQDDRWVSNGCVRLEDSDALARFVFGSVPSAQDPDKEDRVDVEKPVPVYMTYFTAAATPDGVQFRRDPYDRDPVVLAAMEDNLGPLAELAKADLPPDPLAAALKEDAALDLLAPEAGKTVPKKAVSRKIAQPSSAAVVPMVTSKARADAKTAGKGKALAAKPVVKPAGKLREAKASVVPKSTKRPVAKADRASKAPAGKLSAKKTIKKPS
jgi:hypothetical protein